MNCIQSGKVGSIVNQQYKEHCRAERLKRSQLQYLSLLLRTTTTESTFTSYCSWNSE